MKRKLLLILVVLAILLGGAYKLNLYALIINVDKNVYVENVDMPTETEDIDATEVVLEKVIEQDEEPMITNISLLAVGDIMFHSPQVIAAKSNSNTYNFTAAFSHVKKYIEDADIAIGNFETVTAGSERGFSGFPRFNSPIETISALKDTGFDILSTANNHSLDQGKTGLIKTIEAIEEYELKSIGTYKEPGRPILVEEVDGIKLGFLSYTYGLNGLDTMLTKDELGFMVARIDEAIIEEDIKRAKDLEVDLIIVYIHWGHEYHREPSLGQTELAKQMVEWGANIILGSHPHVIQKSEIIEYDGRDNFIIYSMGNFLSNQRYETMGNPYTEDGIMVRLDIEKDSTKNEVMIKNITYIPTWVYRYRENHKINYEILPIEDVLTGELDVIISDTTKMRIEQSLNDTYNTMNN